MAAHASFGGTPCKDFGCHFLFWGGFLGLAGGIPVSVVIFIVLHVAFAHPARSKGKQVILGAFAGVAAFGIAAACAALMVHWGKNPWLGLGAAGMVLAAISVLYARSSPRPAARAPKR